MASKFPEEIDKLKRVQNFPQSQAGNVKRYNELRTKSNLTSAEQSELQNLTQTLSPYMKTVDDMNLEVDAIENVQKFFKQEVDGYVNAKQSEMQSYADTKKNEVEAEISKFSYKGNYRSDLTYQQRNYVTYNDGTGNNTFIAVKNVPAGIDPSNIEYWHKLGIKGEKGNDGIGLVFKGAWNNTDLYEVGSAVQYGGVIFGCLQNNTGQQPDITKDTEYWAKAWAATVITTKLTGTRTINSKTKNVNFMTGEIIAFNPATDTLEVYCNSVALTRNKDYMIGTDNQSIVKIDGEWDGTELPVFFEFRVTRNQLNDLVFSDGQSIAEGTISKNKLTQDIQDNLDSIDVHVNNVSNPHNVTVDQIGAVSQTDFDEHLADKIYQGEVHGMKFVNEKLQVFNGKEWIELKGGGKPVNITKNISIKGEDRQVLLNWTDPDDVVVDGNIVAKWKSTNIVRKEGSPPLNEEDGVLVAKSGVRNQYEATPFVDRGVQNDIEYFYGIFPESEDEIVTVSEKEIISATPTEAKIYGVVIDESNSNPETSVTYTDDAIGFTPMRGNDGNFQWGSWQQIFEDMNIRPCLFKNGQVNYYINPNDYTKKLDGTSADITSGNDGDVMIEFPKIYWKMWKVGTKQYVQFSEKYFDGAKCPAHTVGTVVKDKIYLPAYMGYTLNGKLRSLSGKKPTVSQTIGTFRTQAQANGVGYQQFPYFGLLMLQVLGIVWFKSRDSQTALGRGYVDENDASITTGGTDTKGMFYGETTGKQQIKFAGIEDFWGNTYYWIDGFYSDDNRNMMISNQDVFNDNGSGYKNYGQGATANVYGYIDTVQGGTETGFVIKTSSGSSTTHYCDYGNLDGGYLPRSGSYWNNGSYAGAFQLYVYYSASDSDSNLSARLCFIGN